MCNTTCSRTISVIVFSRSSAVTFQSQLMLNWFFSIRELDEKLIDGFNSWETLLCNHLQASSSIFNKIDFCSKRSGWRAYFKEKNSWRWRFSSFQPYLNAEVLVSKSSQSPWEYWACSCTFRSTVLHTNCTETQPACKHAFAATSFSLALFPQKETQIISREPLFHQTSAKVTKKEKESETSGAPVT